jgi:ferredoxin--NADP+ reductase
MDDKHYRARITRRVDFAPDLWMIRIDLRADDLRADDLRADDPCTNGPGAEFSFLPGQYATLGVEKDSRRLERPYSIVSSPHENELEFFFELVPHGETTPPLYDLQLGDVVLLRKSAKGRFTLDRSQPQRTNHLLLSTVTGVAPFVS